MKKITALLMCIVITASTFVLCPIGNIDAQAASYANTLRNQGFPETYINSIVELHNKYPNWIFKPFITGLEWDKAVDGERSRHSKQLIEKYSGNSTSMYCNCSSCYKNGKYVIQEASNWVSASRQAVEYYMDPRNFLNEKGIFQFESTDYNGTQSQEGVEAILKGTWMENAVISYKNTAGRDTTLASKVTYSKAIMNAANASGMSAYYLASKIRQENGRATASATAVKGTASPFQGIYNYYNIGAYTGAMDGLDWAAGFLRTNKNTTMYSTYSSEDNKVGGTKTALSTNQYMTWRANAGDYFFVRLYNVNTRQEGASGYVAKSDIRTTYIGGSTSPGWGRPWYTPYLSIYYGAKYIAQGYKTQNTGYLQKFNVNPESSEMFGHEYMANVAAAAAESATTYQAYKDADILNITKTFYIPVFSKMPNDSIELDKVTGLTSTGADSASVTLKWNEVDGAQAYQVDVYRGGKWTNFGTTTSTSIRVNGLSQLCIYNFRVRAYRDYCGATYYGDYSDTIKRGARGKIKNFAGTATSTTAVKLSWSKHSKATGYRIYKYNDTKKAYEFYKQVDAGTTSLNVTGLKANTNYKFKMYGFRDYCGVRYTTFATDPITVKTTPTTVTLNSAVSSSAKKITVKWTKLPVSCTGYQVMWSTSSSFSSNYVTTKVSGRNTVSKVITTAQSKKYYYVRVRAYKTANGKTTYYPWSKTIKVYVK